MDPTEDLLAEVLDRPIDQWSTALEELCAAHAGAAPELRRRFAVLRRMGVADRQEPGPAAPADDPFPETFGPYRLVDRLGGGGMGVVYLARHEELGRNVALKMVRPERLYFTDSRERFRREIEAVARLEHPGCVQIHQVGEAQGVPYFAMEYVAGISFDQLVRALADQPVGKLTGQDLARVLRQHSPRSAETASSELFAGPWSRVCLRLVLAVAEALAHAHARGVIHRDLKPSNLMLTPEGRVVVIDFGLAVAEGTSRMTRSGAFLGSLPYMAPEQVRGELKAIDARTDVYALGVCLYELLTLVSPFEAASAETTRDSILAGKALPLRVRNAAVSADIAVLCGKAMDVDPRRRYQQMTDLAADLAAVLEHRAIAARPAGVIRSALRWARRRPAMATALGLGSAAVVFGPLIVSVAIAGQRDRARLAERSASRNAYAANVAAANAALLSGNGAEARRRLDACPRDERGFEWRHLDLALDGALQMVQAHRAAVSTVALATDGHTMASGANNGEVVVLDVATGKRLHELQTGTRPVGQLEFDGAATELYVNTGGHLRVFSVETGALLRERPPLSRFESLLITPGAEMVLCHLGGGRTEQIDPHTLLLVGETALEARPVPMGASLFLSDGKQLVAPNGSGLAKWDLASGQMIAWVAMPRNGALSMCIQSNLQSAGVADAEGNLAWVDFAHATAQVIDTGGRVVVDVVITADGHLLVAGCQGGELLVYELPSGRMVRRLFGHRSAVRVVMAGTENDLVLTGDSAGTVRLWSPFLAPEVLDLTRVGDGASVATHGDRVFHGSMSGALRCVDAHTGAQIWQNQHKHWVNAVAVVRGGTEVVSSFHNSLRFCDATTGATLGEVGWSQGGYAQAMATDAAGDRVFLITIDGFALAIDAVGRSIITQAKAHAGEVWGLAYDHRTDTLLTAGKDGCLRESSARDLTESRALVAAGPPFGAILLDGDSIVCSQLDGLLCRRDRRTGAILQQRPYPPLASIAPLGEDRFITGAADSRVAFWDRRDLELMLELKQPASSVRLVAADAQARWVAVTCIGGDPRILYASPPVRGSGFGGQFDRAQVAAARALAMRVWSDSPYSPSAQRRLAARSGLSRAFVTLAARMLPPVELWHIGAGAMGLAEHPPRTTADRELLERYRDMLREAVRDNPASEHAPMTRLGLGLICVRLGQPQEALDVVRDLTREGVGAHRAEWCLMRALAHASVGDAAEAAAATAELRTLAGKAAQDATVYAYLRELEAANR